jgi:hypothetical protein
MDTKKMINNRRENRKSVSVRISKLVGVMGFSGAWRKLIQEKILQSKIS